MDVLKMEPVSAERQQEILKEIGRDIARKYDTVVCNYVAKALRENGLIWCTSEDVYEIVSKAYAYDKLGELYNVESLEGIRTKHGDRCKKLENKVSELEEKLNAIRKIVGEVK